MTLIHSPDPPMSTSLLAAFWHRDTPGWKLRAPGQGLVEYALILVLIAIVVIGGLTVLGDQLEGVYVEISCALGGSCSAPDPAAAPPAAGGPTGRTTPPIMVGGVKTCPAGYSLPSASANICLRD
ncbi:MAG: Flp family type IVb pilin [Candidatus Viridilinea halotolerans]|uniref:Flp family type IVb pilin n=1 Tax=Candidatus Viridilinea halotolerans TaxID=2491704 RepID=A0A426U7H5_9CHLR|nr:MAG: Flp family type IVb pilin [Candidatus Viridilinea halotolerans]